MFFHNLVDFYPFSLYLARNGTLVFNSLTLKDVALCVHCSTCQQGSFLDSNTRRWLVIQTSILFFCDWIELKIYFQFILGFLCLLFVLIWIQILALYLTAVGGRWPASCFGCWWRRRHLLDILHYFGISTPKPKAPKKAWNRIKNKQPTQKFIIQCKNWD